VNQAEEDSSSISFVIPDSCLVKHAPVCQIADLGANGSVEEDIVTGCVPPSAPERKRRGQLL
jgi:hypothetical protein